MKPKILFFLILAFASVICGYGQDRIKKISITGVALDPYKRPVPDEEVVNVEYGSQKRKSLSSHQSPVTS